MIRAQLCVDQLKGALSTQSTPSQSAPKVNAINGIVGKSKLVTRELATIIQETNDVERLEELLTVNDQLLNLLRKVPGGGKPTLTLQGLGLTLNNTQLKPRHARSNTTGSTTTSNNTPFSQMQMTVGYKSFVDVFCST